MILNFKSMYRKWMDGKCELLRVTSRTTKGHPLTIGGPGILVYNVETGGIG